MKRVSSWALVAVLAVVLLTVSGAATAAPGDLDPSFGAGGMVTTDFAGGFDEAYALVGQPDGKLVAAGLSSGSWALVRYHGNGALDTSFGSGGRVTTETGEAQAVVLQPDGKLVAAGRTGGAGGTDIALVRYNPDGTLDTTFGIGGLVTTDFAAGNDRGWGLVLEPDGRLVAAGRTTAGGTWDFALVRYRPDGTLDPTFGSGGRVITDFAGGSDEAYALVRQPDGKLVAGGSCKLARYNHDGSLDASFGSGGKVTTPFSGCYYTPLALQSDGKLLTTGFSPGAGGAVQFGVARYNADGTQDSEFGSGGIVPSDFEVLGLAIQPDGKLITAGTKWGTTNLDIGVARFSSDGVPDIGFGSGGIVTIDSGSHDLANEALLQPDGRIVTAGSIAAVQDFSLHDIALTRIQGDATAVPFAWMDTVAFMSVPAGIANDSLRALSTFGLGAESNGIDPVAEPLRVDVGATSLMLPPGSLSKGRLGWSYRGASDGATWTVLLARLVAGHYVINVTGKGLDLPAPSGSIDVRITIGDDAGSASVKPLVLPRA